MLQKQSLIISAMLLNIHMWHDDDEYCQKEDRNESCVEKACFLSVSFYQKPISCEETAYVFFYKGWPLTSRGASARTHTGTWGDL